MLSLSPSSQVAMSHNLLSCSEVLLVCSKYLTVTTFDLEFLENCYTEVFWGY